MSKLPDDGTLTSGIDNLSTIATRVTIEIAGARLHVHEDETTREFLLKDMNPDQLESIDNMLGTVIAAAYLPLAKSAFIHRIILITLLTISGNRHMTRCTAANLTRRLDNYKLSYDYWDRDGGKNDSVIE
jgi:hypothetical protein